MLHQLNNGSLHNSRFVEYLTRWGRHSIKIPNKILLSHIQLSSKMRRLETGFHLINDYAKPHQFPLLSKNWFRFFVSFGAQHLLTASTCCCAVYQSNRIRLATEKVDEFSLAIVIGNYVFVSIKCLHSIKHSQMFAFFLFILDECWHSHNQNGPNGK